MSRSILCLLWLKGEVERGPIQFQGFARELHAAIDAGTDEASTEAYQWLGHIAENGHNSRRRSARMCLAQLDDNRPRDTEECPMFFQEEARAS